MRILITGATGLVGTELAHAFFRLGHDIVVVSRDPERAKKHFAVPVEVFRWNAPHEDFPVEALAGVDAVANLMGENIAAGRWTTEQKKKIYDSRVVGTRKLAEAIQKTGRTLQVFLGASAVGFYGDRKDEILTESANSGEGFLPEVCRDWEAASAAVPAERTAIFRLGVVLSRNEGFLPRLLPIFRKGLGGPVGSGSQWVPWIHIVDLVRLFTNALSHTSFKGPVIAASPSPVTNRELGATLAAVLDKPFGMPAPAFALKLAMGEMASLALDSTRAVGGKHAEGLQFPLLRTALENLLQPEREGICVFEAEKWLNRPIDEVFRFFSAAENLETITPPWLNFHVVRKSTPRVQEGTLIDYKLKIKGVPTKWRSRIEEWTPPLKFVDTQVHGPYKHWHHTHTFESVRGGTWMKDFVRYRLPLGALGKAMMGGMIEKDVETIFGFRSSKMTELFAQ